ncbi:amino acid adenylation domain-containing protein, partial [Streptomyces sp. AK02-01A]|uniref:amino acid adenylation domain-containing protein n=1 Tax=Streptomyces sp. AK02-01A TaxID=3028648 RepID=UPI0029B35339
RSSLFERETVERFGAHLLRAMRFLAGHPHRPVRAVELLGEDERALVLGQFNDTARPYPDSTPIHQLFADQVRRTPDATALSWRRTNMTYRQLSELAGRLAAALYAAGVRTGDRVALRTERTPDFVVGALAILMAGGGYLPVEPGYPRERTELLLADSGVGVLVTAPGLTGDFAFDGTVVATDAQATDAQATGAPLESAGSADDLAYVCYTSGTTGKPKGVEVTHRNVVRLVKGAEYADLGPDTTILPTGSIVFDANTFEIWGALLNGGSLRLVDNDTVLSARRLSAELTAHRVTTMWLTSALFNQLAEQDASTFRPLRQLLVGGDALSAPHVAKVMAACPGLTLVNGYGPTENTTFSVTHRLTAADLDRIPIGRPISNSRAYILDEDDRLSPIGVPGELCLGGAGVARGYLGRADLTAERFAADPFVPGGRMYRSGDLARWRPDGVIEFLGRRDHQVKVRGFRVEPAEIEKAMLGHPDITEALVMARSRHGRADKFLCGYYVSRREVTADELRSRLALTLPGHMVPSYLTELPELPLNHNGKVDRGRLPDPDGARLAAGAEFRAPTGESERILVELTERALGLSGIGVRHDLRDLGADSLTATLIAAGVETRLGRRCPVSAVLRAGTLEALARLLDTLGPAAGPEIEAAPELPSYPLTPQQRQVYFEQLKDEKAVHYNVPVTLDLPADTDPRRLAKALGELTARHDALRTRFVIEGAEVRQLIEPEVPLPLRVLDGPPPAVEEFVRPFDLARAPLWRAELHRTGTGCRLRVDLHHIVVDGFSLVTLFEDLAELYAGHSPEPPAVQYRDYAVWLTGPAGQALRDGQAAYWREAFAEPVVPADLPTDFERPAMRALDGATVEFDLGPARAEALRRLARGQDVTLFAVLASAYHVLLSALKGTTDVTVGTPVSGRTVSGVHRTLGMFANTVCLRNTVDPRASFSELLREVGRNAEDAFAHQDFPFEELVALAAPDRDYSRTPLFDALIALHSGRYLSVDLGGSRVPLRLEPNGQAVFDLNTQIYEVSGTLRVSWQYAAGLLLRTTVESWRDAFVALLDAVAADPSAEVGALLAAHGPAPAPAPEPVSGFDFNL